ncbi:Bro-N domain-containing protein [Alicyclobacillus macrosporangiidus]|uniref:BRO-N domain-containing protein n=1 Tax=Alicyclobacillus macrosporangiidus TaxID=392015 RepID=UPI0026ED6E29|nr:Bro-N domain-containing protein [Alicyclobacillus macrosporangiidus]
MDLTVMGFDYGQKQVRIVLMEHEPWFVAADVLAVLALDRKALERLDEDEKGVSSIHTPGGNQNMTIVNEPGLYNLILGSRKPEAKAFKRWITHDVLPSIRKTGVYVAPVRKVQDDEAAQLKVKRLAIMELNAKTRQAKLLFDVTQRFRDRLSDTAIEGLLAVGAKVLTGQELIPLPATERMYTASEIAAELGVSANKVGRVANMLGLKTNEYGMYVLDKSPYSDKQVEAFRYNERGRQRLIQYFSGTVQSDESSGAR